MITINNTGYQYRRPGENGRAPWGEATLFPATPMFFEK